MGSSGLESSSNTWGYSVFFSFIIKSKEKIFDSYFNQNYAGPLELCFVVSEMTDPIVPVIQNYLKKYPNADAKLLVSTTRQAYWKKIDAYYDAYKTAKHD